MAPKEYSDYDYKKWLAHYGVKGQTWGVRNGPPYPLNFTGTKSVEELSNFMREIKYSKFTMLKSPKEVVATKSGSCHDQVVLELHELKRLGKNPVGLFMMEFDPKTQQGGMTHSLAFYQDGQGVSWFENAWPERAGINHFKSVREIRKAVMQAHKSGEYGNKKDYPEMTFGVFNLDKVKPGMDLQEFVDACLPDD